MRSHSAGVDLQCDLLDEGIFDLGALKPCFWWMLSVLAVPSVFAVPFALGQSQKLPRNTEVCSWAPFFFFNRVLDTAPV
jgi:hypothetical protein